jgi:3',5'-cyclic AMP phosphodiesterase CpdA
MKKTALLLIGIALILTYCSRKSPTSSVPSEDEFTFAYLADIHLQPELHAMEGFRLAIDTLNKINPDFILTGGDLIRDALGQTWSRSDSLYNIYMEMTGDLNMPVYNTIGNHEVFGWYREEEEITGHPEFGKKMYENRLGERFYSFDHKGWHFIVLDAIGRAEDGGYFGLIEDEQIEWLKNDLEKVDKQTPIALSVHIPFISVRTQLVKGSTVPNADGLVITNARDVLLNLYEYNLRLVLQGHLHFLEDIYVGDKTHFITAGAVCGLWWNNKPGSTPEEGFLLVRVKGEQIEWEYVDYGWVTESQRRAL